MTVWQPMPHGSPGMTADVSHDVHDLQRISLPDNI